MFKKINKLKLLIIIATIFPFFYMYGEDNSKTVMTYSKLVDSSKIDNSWWYNQDIKTRGIIKFRIFRDKFGNPLIELRGKCHSKNCKIGPYSLTFYGDSVVSKNAISAMVRYKKPWLHEGYFALRFDTDKAKMWTFSEYNDKRSNSSNSYTFSKSKPSDSLIKVFVSLF